MRCQLSILRGHLRLREHVLEAQLLQQVPAQNQDLRLQLLKGHRAVNCCSCTPGQPHDLAVHVWRTACMSASAGQEKIQAQFPCKKDSSCVQ